MEMGGSAGVNCCACVLGVKLRTGVEGGNCGIVSRVVPRHCELSEAWRW
jgi:hypothetical protein